MKLKMGMLIAVLSVSSLMAHKNEPMRFIVDPITIDITTSVNTQYAAFKLAAAASTIVGILMVKYAAEQTDKKNDDRYLIGGIGTIFIAGGAYALKYFYDLSTKVVK